MSLRTVGNPKEGLGVRKFASVAITIVAVSLAAFIGIRAMQLNGVYELGPAISFEPQAPGSSSAIRSQRTCLPHT